MVSTQPVARHSACIGKIEAWCHISCWEPPHTPCSRTVCVRNPADAGVLNSRVGLKPNPKLQHAPPSSPSYYVNKWRWVLSIVWRQFCPKRSLAFFFFFLNLLSTIPTLCFHFVRVARRASLPAFKKKVHVRFPICPSIYSSLDVQPISVGASPSWPPVSWRKQVVNSRWCALN